MQIVNFILTALINIGIALVLFFFLLIALNGYSERQATPGLILYIAWAIFFSLLAATLSVLLAKRLVGKRSFSPLGAFALASPIFTILGAGLNFSGIFAAIFLIEALR